ncbi:alpha/beta fold hydrolase [Allosaccharopolyspora coralli]|uniref:Alpha/beta fold hydrolase n=1 Tax=Allosaccharopolyspora coralli TaxID=2665642 RepID=A0A5Q3QBC2_9PSEU|nr:alpha/beta hydrolase [Allosaccharopolyspora coralli]QGK68909.1 alpha/beta fold hydrolase [Allosaccharopolyspora coralli]
MAVRTLDRSSVFTTSDGVRLHVSDTGPDAAPVTVVFLHGWTLDLATWDTVCGQLDEGLRLLRFDLRGHGRSQPAPPETATIERCALDLAELIDERVPTGPIVLAGHSMGAMTIMALAEGRADLFAERIAGVALVATSGGGLGLSRATFGLPGPLGKASTSVQRGLQRWLAGNEHSRLLRDSRTMRPGVRWLLFGKRARRADVAATAESLACCHPRSMGQFRESLATHERLERIEALRSVPTVVLAGLSDRLTPYPHARRLARALPEAELLVHADAGHMLPLERGDAVAARISDLVRRVWPDESARAGTDLNDPT